MDYTSNRRQEVLSLARKITADSGNYPEVMQTTARTYLDMNNERRDAILSLRKNKRLVAIRKLFKEHNGYSSLTANRRKAGHVIRIAYPDESNVFHKAKNFMYDNINWKFSSVMEFLFMDKLMEYRDIESIHKYFQCVNARRCDDSLADVGFLRVIRQSVVIEILSFKMLKS